MKKTMVGLFASLAVLLVLYSLALAHTLFMMVEDSEDRIVTVQEMFLIGATGVGIGVRLHQL